MSEPEKLPEKPKLNRRFRMQWEEAQNSYVLLYPEGMIRLNGSAGEIMRRCDGERSIAAIVDELQAAFNASGLEPEVLSFVEIAGKQKWLTWE